MAVEELERTIRALEGVAAAGTGKISTISVYIKFDKEVDTAELPNFFKIKIPGERKNRRALYQNFPNSLTAVFSGRTCAKISRRGAQICGCKSWNDIEPICAEIRSKLALDITTASVHLFNTVVKAKEPLDLESIRQIAEKQRLQTAYDREEYSGLRIKSNGLTCLMFSSGSIILTGCKQASDLEAMYQILSSLNINV